MIQGSKAFGVGEYLAYICWAESTESFFTMDLHSLVAVKF